MNFAEITSMKVRTFARGRSASGRFRAIYLFNLLGPGEAMAIVVEVRRLPRPGGLLAVAR